MNANHAPNDSLDAAEASLRELPAHIVPLTATLDRIAAHVGELDTPLMPRHIKTVWSSRGRRFAAMLLTSAALVAVVFGLMHSPQEAFALEDIAAAVREVSTLTYTTVLTPKNGSASQLKNYHKGKLARTESIDGSYRVTDSAERRMLSVRPGVKAATLTKLGSGPQDVPTMSDSIIAWLKTAETTGEPAGDKTINGVRTQGFKATFGATTMTLWGDPKTKLPVLIEATIGSLADPIHMVMQDFVFNQPLPDAMFSFEIPTGFKTEEITFPSVDFTALGKVPPEDHVVRVLRFYAKLNDGAFPERIDGPELVAKITKAAGADRVNNPEFMKEFMELTGSMGAAWTFRQSLDKFGYDGTARLDDADRIVFWYLPKGAEKYRVVFADLTIGDAPEAKLPKAPKK
ncbi:LolA family protein [Planctomyces sp. SH-PL14]|uniref:LolA family protein n=1 Tax=Planctomyces sp. SH-PL14 TaxID=1632864 RepID=UPI00078E799C|nr:hypothetical protein [Planctomyces sp. SH-PL14]AMV16960.1 hypothetical protein VT03_03660 [Planctomyces sp. SH-PL14]